MATFCILNWHLSFDNLRLVRDEDGEPLLFDSREGAEDFAEDNVMFKWKVMKID